MDDLRKIKKYYGEKMMHFCNDNFSSILETKGLLFELMQEYFYYSKDLYNDIIENELELSFKKYIFSLASLVKNRKNVILKSPMELMDEAGYILYECHNEEEIQQFRKYYDKCGEEYSSFDENGIPHHVGEELCTFDGGRLKKCLVFFAVKKDVDSIKKSDNPKREDDYGTSVLSIQFDNDGFNTLSIKNRYNHSVENPDATFSNNLENIIPGLTDSFEKYYNFCINLKKELLKIPSYTRGKDSKLYKYNYKDGYKYYCPNNIIIDRFEVKKYDKERYIVFDYFVLDMKEKKIIKYDNTYEDSFVDTCSNIEKIDIVNNRETNIKEIVINGEIIIYLDKSNMIVGYKNNICEDVGNNFLSHCKKLQYLELSNVKVIGDYFKGPSKELKIPSVEQIGDWFSADISNIDLPSIKKIGKYFLYSNDKLKELYLPLVEYIGAYPLYFNRKVVLYTPKLKKECYIQLQNQIRYIQDKYKIITNELEERERVLQKNKYRECKKIYKIC